MISRPVFVEVPFANRHHCWFCNEPAGHSFSFPHHEHLLFDCPHPELIVPSCLECARAAIKAKVNSIWQVDNEVKKFLLHKYRKDLAIGVNWTEAELAQSEFEGGCFSGFQKSAWFVYEVAKARVNFQGWPLVVEGLAIEKAELDSGFDFDGVTYPSIEEAIVHYSYCYDLDEKYLRQVLFKLGLTKFSQAIRFSRLLVGATAREKKQALKDI